MNEVHPVAPAVERPDKRARIVNRGRKTKLTPASPETPK